jgi:membrane-bound lytic murein transglycosylase MltF
MKTWIATLGRLAGLGRTRAAGAVAIAAVCAFAACGPSPPGERSAAPGSGADAIVPGQSLLPDAVSSVLFEKWTGDLDGMMTRRIIRAGVVFSRTHYFIDRGMQRGVAYESLKLFEDQLNRRRKPADWVHVVFVPLSREALLPALLNGQVDLVAAMVPVTAESQKVVDFSPPTRTGISDVVVTGPGGPPIGSVDDLAGQRIFVRSGSSYYASLTKLNEQFRSRGMPQMHFELAPGTLEDDDLLEMVNGGLVKVVVVHDYLAQFWSKVLPNLNIHTDAKVATEGNLAVAMRKNSPKLMAAAAEWVEAHGPATTFTNVINQRYLGDTKFVSNATSAAERKRFDSMVALFRKYARQYDLDYLMMMAQAYQESGLNQGARSAAGAVGVMQVIPATGSDMKVGNIRQLEPNIHAGVKYIRFMIDQYFVDEPMTQLNKGLFAFAAYNAGPARVRGLRALADKRGLDRNVWFNNVERIASEQIGRETVQYVANIFKYYVAYRLVMGQDSAVADAGASSP